eukprot:scaffold2857_cov121-Isochrysis_galbana.AAC.6
MCAPPIFVQCRASAASGDSGEGSTGTRTGGVRASCATAEAGCWWPSPCPRLHMLALRWWCGSAVAAPVAGGRRTGPGSRRAPVKRVAGFGSFDNAHARPGRRVSGLGAGTVRTRSCLGRVVSAGRVASGEVSVGARRGAQGHWQRRLPVAWLLWL